MLSDELLFLYISGNASDQERNEVLQWLHSNKENQHYFEKLRDIYLATGVFNNKTTDVNKSWENLKTKFYSRRPELKDTKTITHTFRIGSVIRYAAVITAAFVFGILLQAYFSNQKKSENMVYNQVIAPLGSKAMVILADGTKVWLNAGSKLRYPANFSAGTRDVYLDGEAYFDVTKQMRKKFIVHTSFLNIKVLGTEFNVKAYSEEKTIQTTLVKGAITIENAENSSILKKPIALVPNQLASFNKYASSDLKNTVTPQQRKYNVNNRQNNEVEEPITVLPGINPEIYTSWKEDKWVIQGEELESLAIKLERRYNIKISIENESVKHYKFSGTLRDETLQQVLNIIKITAPIKYTIENKNVTLEENKTSKKSYDEKLIRR